MHASTQPNASHPLPPLTGPAQLPVGVHGQGVQRVQVPEAPLGVLSERRLWRVVHRVQQHLCVWWYDDEVRKRSKANARAHTRHVLFLHNFTPV